MSIDNNSPDSMSFVEHYVLRRGRLIDKRREAKKTIAIATVYPTRSAVIVISKGLFATWNNVAGMEEKL